MRILRLSTPARDLLVALLVGTCFCLPMIVGRPAFFIDWQNHLYLVAKQARYVTEHVTPTFFLNTTDRGWFYPFYAFYGGTLYYVAAFSAMVLQSAWTAYVGSYLVSMAAVFAAWTSLARQSGLRGHLVFLPGLVHLSSAYYLTNAYGRGAWPEFVATSAIPVVLAAAWSVLTRGTVHLPALLALIISMILLIGSHIITLIFSLPFIAIALAVAIAIRRPETLSHSRLAVLVGVIVLAICINGWFLIPLMSYRDTIAVQPGVLRARELDELYVIFGIPYYNPLHQSTPQLYVQAPVIPLGISIAVIAIGILKIQNNRLLLLAIAAQIAFGLVLVFLSGERVWGWLPREARIIQFPYRLNTYLLLCIVGLVLIACRYAKHLHVVRPRLGATLIGLLTIGGLTQLGFAQNQIWSARTYGPADQVLADLDRLPATFYDSLYFSRTGKNIAGPQTVAKATSPSLDAWNIEFLAPSNEAPSLVRTDVIFSPLVAFDPPRVVGMSDGYVVLDVPPSPVTTSFAASGARTPATVVGALLSWFGVLGTVGMLAWFWWRERQRATTGKIASPDPSPSRPNPREALLFE